ncbi:hypothetical protein FisN_14Lh016 [Fistulifera solaris]|uniref:F-box domain-containing protein n=1 Tax=Fistulifera solaris TaxID=1519565 RepID=A0A1Z5KHI8_FISSO|nr:hypothetical protein FisN_14Lh016 [Fistulifera solaris]|eukprot:GAX25706.1 hypothetical protein FisN_14Lh016 [Fistulifera solaris]
MIDSIPFEVRLLCWEYLSVKDYGSLAMTCRSWNDDRRHLHPTRYVCISSPTHEQALQRSRILHQNQPILLRLETVLPRKHVPLLNVTELELALGLPVVVSAICFPNVTKVTLSNNTQFRDQQQMGKFLHNNVEVLIIQDNDRVPLNGHDLREFQALHTLILQNCCLQLTEVSDARCELDLFSWIKAPLRHVAMRRVHCPGVSQTMLMNFVRRRPLLQYFESDVLTEDNKSRLRNELPYIQIV